ncbi:hypothetical protein BDZ97DRAFT_1930682 [Flammula alnicola]|nr:hypothetical protein BDZ97DRAFT_1930682 [Flammula alnicola]
MPQNITAVDSTLNRLDRALHALTVPPPKRKAMDTPTPAEESEPTRPGSRRSLKGVLKSSLARSERRNIEENRPKKTVRIIGHIDPLYDNGRHKVTMSSQTTFASGSSAGLSSTEYVDGSLSEPSHRLPTRGRSTLLDLKARLVDPTGVHSVTPQLHFAGASSTPNPPADPMLIQLPAIPSQHACSPPIPQPATDGKRKSLFQLAASLAPRPVLNQPSVRIQPAARHILPSTAPSAADVNPSPIGQDPHQIQLASATGLADEVMCDTPGLSLPCHLPPASSANSLTHGMKESRLLTLAARLPVPPTPTPPTQAEGGSDADDISMDSEEHADRIPIETIIRVKMEQADEDMDWNSEDVASEDSPLP